MGKALIEIETYNNGVGTRIKYIPKEISPYHVIGILYMLIKRILEGAENSEKSVEFKV